MTRLYMDFFFLFSSFFFFYIAVIMSSFYVQPRHTRSAFHSAMCHGDSFRSFTLAVKPQWCGGEDQVPPKRPETFRLSEPCHPFQTRIIIITLLSFLLALAMGPSCAA